MPKSKTQLYCNELKTENCLHCKKEFSYKCRKSSGVKQYCERKCYLADKNTPRKKCVICGGPAIDKYCKEVFTKKCPVCNKDMEYKHSNSMPTFCSVKCAGQDESIKEKRNRTQIEKYGALGFNTQKQKDTMIERYGYETPAKNDKVKEKIRNTQYKRNEGKFAFNTKKQKETMRKRSAPNRNKVISKLNLSFKLGLEKRFNVNVELEKRVGRFVYDLYIPNFNLLIDLNPTISHNITKTYLCSLNSCSESCSKHKLIPRNYHNERMLSAKIGNFEYIQVFEYVSYLKILELIEEVYTNKNLIKICTISESEKDIIKNDFINLYSTHISNFTVNENREIHIYKDREDYFIDYLDIVSFDVNSVLEIIKYVKNCLNLDDLKIKNDMSYLISSHTANVEFITHEKLNSYYMNKSKFTGNESSLEVVPPCMSEVLYK